MKLDATVHRVVGTDSGPLCTSWHAPVVRVDRDVDGSVTMKSLTRSRLVDRDVDQPRVSELEVEEVTVVSINTLEGADDCQQLFSRLNHKLVGLFDPLGAAQEDRRVMSVVIHVLHADLNRPLYLDGDRDDVTTIQGRESLLSGDFLLSHNSSPLKVLY